MSINSRKKGKAGELSLVHELQKYGHECRRGQQFCGANGDPDVVGLPGIHIECKRVENLNLGKAMEQAINDAKDGEMPCVFHKKNRKPWYVTMRLEDWIKLYDHQS